MSGVREWDRSPFGDGTTPPGSGAPPSPAVPPTPDAATERLTVGPAAVVIAPATDPDVVAGLVGLIAAIPALHRVDVDAVEDGQARLTVTPRHPVVLAAELRRALGTRVRSCVPAAPGGRVVVDARPPVPPAPPAPDPVDAPSSFSGDLAAGDETQDEEPPPGDDPDGSSDAGDGDPGTRPRTGEDDPTGEEGSPRDGARGARARPGDTGPEDVASGAADEQDESTGGRWTRRGAGRDRAGRGDARRGRGRRGAGRGSPEPDHPDDGAGRRSAGGPAPEAADPAVVVAALTAAVGDTPGLSVLVFDAELRIRAVAGVTPDGGDGSVLLGRPVVHAFLPVARRPVAAALSAALAGQERTVALTDEDGVEGRLEVTCRPVGPGVAGGVCIVRDLEEGGTGTLLIEATRAFEITFRHSPIGQGLLSRSGHWLRVNGALAELLGRPADELTGGEAVETMHPDDREQERARLRGLVDGDADHYVVGVRFVHVDGHVVRTHTRMTRITDEHGVARGFVAQIVDAAAWARFGDG